MIEVLQEFNGDVAGDVVGVAKFCSGAAESLGHYCTGKRDDRHEDPELRKHHQALRDAAFAAQSALLELEELSLLYCTSHEQDDLAWATNKAFEEPSDLDIHLSMLRSNTQLMLDDQYADGYANAIADVQYYLRGGR